MNVNPTARTMLSERCDERCHSCHDCCECESESFRSAARLRRWAWWLAMATIFWNSLEAVIAIGSGIVARSIALIGFGLDSVVEVASAVVITWRLWRHGDDEVANERAEQRAVRLIALSFFAIALYVTADAVQKLMGLGAHPEPSGVGLLLVVLSLVVMPMLAWAKRRVARQLDSVALTADAAQTKICTYLSAVVLVGLAAHGLWGWWWMDPLAGLVVAGLALHEGRKAWISGDLCCELDAEDLAPCSVDCCPLCPIVVAA
jgi:divalent metal cation (Fe/Co/Zn/Cd) transporter